MRFSAGRNLSRSPPRKRRGPTSLPPLLKTMINMKWSLVPVLVCCWIATRHYVRLEADLNHFSVFRENAVTSNGSDPTDRSSITVSSDSKIRDSDDRSKDDQLGAGEVSNDEQNEEEVVINDEQNKEEVVSNDEQIEEEAVSNDEQIEEDEQEAMHVANGSAKNPNPETEVSRREPDTEENEALETEDDNNYHTGSFQNCTAEGTENNLDTSTILDSETSGTITVSCRKIRFRAPLESFNNEISIIVGVLSSASGSGPIRRQSIRDTWASGRSAIFFLVAGPWEDIKDEYETMGDLVWIDEEEVYDGEQSVLTLKTYSFLAIARAAVEKFNYNYTHLFKTDDDSYVNLDALYRVLHPTEEDKKEIEDNDNGKEEEDSSSNATYSNDYVGQCQQKHAIVHREKDYKWPLKHETYPEPWFPRYCQGAGFAVSRKFVNCATTDNISNIRFMPFEDVAVGMLAQRCNIIPARSVKRKFNVNRYKSEEARSRARTGDKRTDDLLPPPACMLKKVVQHRIIDDEDMKNHHQSMLDPNYCDALILKRKKIAQDLRSKGIKFYG